jgi:flagellar biosynthesis GTPase FlhF
MKNFGINYKVSRLSNTKKEGSIPSIDIESVEESILDEERKVESRCSPVHVHVEYLIDLYSKAIDYYSATNNSRYITIKKKMQEMLKNENFSSEDRKKEIDIEIHPEKEEEKKEKKEKEEKKEDFEEGMNNNKDKDKEIHNKTDEKSNSIENKEKEVKEVKEDDKSIIKVYEDDEDEN